MNKFFPYYPILVGFIVVAVMALAQPMPPIPAKSGNLLPKRPVAASARSRVATNSVVIHTNVPQNITVTVTAQPLSSRLVQSSDLTKSWQAVANNPLVLRNPAGNCYFKAVNNEPIAVTWSNQSPNAVGFMILQWCDSKPYQWLTIQVTNGQATTFAAQAMGPGTNYFRMEAFDTNMDLSSMTTLDTNSTVPIQAPSVSITSSNSP